MKKYIFNNFDRITKNNDEIVLYSSLYNKEITLKGENVSKYLINNIDMLREYVSVKELLSNIRQLHENTTEKDVYDFLEVLVKKDILKITEEENYYIKKNICILDFNPDSDIYNFLEKIHETGIDITYVIPKKNNFNISERGFLNIVFLEEISFLDLSKIDMYIFIDYRYEFFKELFLKLKRSIEGYKKPILFITATEEVSILGPLVVTDEDVSYEDREYDFKEWSNYKIKNRLINSNLSYITMSKIYVEMYREILCFYREGYFSSLINEYLIIDNHMRTVNRRHICSFER
mgnify:FL=1